MLNIFIEAIKEKRLIEVTFVAKLNENFNPADYVSWETNWEITRD